MGSPEPRPRVLAAYPANYRRQRSDVADMVNDSVRDRVPVVVRVPADQALRLDGRIRCNAARWGYSVSIQRFLTDPRIGSPTDPVPPRDIRRLLLIMPDQPVWLRVCASEKGEQWWL